ncbi:MAG: NAD(+) diphosphatase [Victivallaceae bacterium]|nr:NAD(+) diphosphatase [Victivallaceae bacterium]
MDFRPAPVRSYNSPALSNELLIALRGDKLVLRRDRALPNGSDLSVAGRLCFGELDDRPCSLVELDPDSPLPEGVCEFELREARLMLSPEADVAVCRARELRFWRASRRFCGKCGAELADKSDECARTCSSCGSVFYPVIAPAVIVAVTDPTGRLLLAHNRRFKAGLFGLIAGFVEAGETLEQAVAREIAEEVGLMVDNISYVSSQSWPYPNSLMLGFTARCPQGEPKPDMDEITEAGFFSPAELPQVPSPGSIARRLIDDWRTQYEGISR